MASTGNTFGYCGKILRVDLTGKEVTAETGTPLPQTLLDLGLEHSIRDIP